MEYNAVVIAALHELAEIVACLPPAQLAAPYRHPVATHFGSVTDVQLQIDISLARFKLDDGRHYLILTVMVV